MADPPSQDRPAAPAGSVLRQVERWRGDTPCRLEDVVAEEVPVAIVCNGEPFAVMMATPADLADFAIGFALGEGLVERPGDARVERIGQLLEGIEIRLAIPPARTRELARRRRNLEGRSGCGICGSRMLEDVVRHPAPVTAEPRVSAAAMRRALRGLQAAQAINAATGATHAAGWAQPDGTLRLAREDVGRHNALDKLVGAMHAAGLDPATGFAVVTSRASYEMVMKAASAGIALLAAISAPTALAIALAQRANLSLVGFAREQGHTVYSHGRRLLPADGP
jgi:FdhD protein